MTKERSEAHSAVADRARLEKRSHRGRRPSVPGGVDAAAVDAFHSQARRSHKRRNLSELPDTTRVLSGKNATEVTIPACPSGVAAHSPVSASHSRRKSSQLLTTNQPVAVRIDEDPHPVAGDPASRTPRLYFATFCSPTPPLRRCLPSM